VARSARRRRLARNAGVGCDGDTRAAGAEQIVCRPWLCHGDVYDAEEVVQFAEFGWSSHRLLALVTP
jgi:hypothetical protein